MSILIFIFLAAVLVSVYFMRFLFSDKVSEDLPPDTSISEAEIISEKTTMVKEAVVYPEPVLVEKQEPSKPEEQIKRTYPLNLTNDEKLKIYQWFIKFLSESRTVSFGDCFTHYNIAILPPGRTKLELIDLPELKGQFSNEIEMYVAGINPEKRIEMLQEAIEMLEISNSLKQGL